MSLSPSLSLYISSWNAFLLLEKIEPTAYWETRISRVLVVGRAVRAGRSPKTKINGSHRADFLFSTPAAAGSNIFCGHWGNLPLPDEMDFLEPTKYSESHANTQIQIFVDSKPLLGGYHELHMLYASTMLSPHPHHPIGFNFVLMRDDPLNHDLLHRGSQYRSTKKSLNVPAEIKSTIRGRVWEVRWRSHVGHNPTTGPASSK